MAVAGSRYWARESLALERVSSLFFFFTLRLEWLEAADRKYCLV